MLSVEATKTTFPDTAGNALKGKPALLVDGRYFKDGTPACWIMQWVRLNHPGVQFQLMMSR